MTERHARLMRQAVVVAAARADARVGSRRAGSRASRPLHRSRACRSKSSSTSTSRCRWAATERVMDAPAAIALLTPEDLRRNGAVTLPEALRTVPGLFVARFSASSWVITTRGFASNSANKMLVMIDGRTVYSPLFSGVFWDQQDVMLDDLDAHRDRARARRVALGIERGERRDQRRVEARVGDAGHADHARRRRRGALQRRRCAMAARSAAGTSAFTRSTSTAIRRGWTTAATPMTGSDSGRPASAWTSVKRRPASPFRATPTRRRRSSRIATTSPRTA